MLNQEWKPWFILQYVVASQKIPVLLILYSISFLVYPSGELCLELREEEKRRKRKLLWVSKRGRGKTVEISCLLSFTISLNLPFYLCNQTKESNMLFLYFPLFSPTSKLRMAICLVSRQLFVNFVLLISFKHY